jgi:hypothetical protein
MADELKKDLKTLSLFISLYCQCRHGDRAKAPVLLKTHDVREIAGRDIALCPDCHKLLIHALVKRSNCPMNPKPMCKHCPNHCYHPVYRAQIQEVMRYAGRRMIMGGRLDYLFHLLF